MDFTNNLIKNDQSLKDALNQLNKVPDSLTLFVLDQSNSLIGTLTDGDIRRALLSDVKSDQTLSHFMNKTFKYLSSKDSNLDKIREYRSKGVKLLPWLDSEMKILKVIDISKKRSLLPLDAIIMAGGIGSRLRPQTLTVPKPLLKVANKPIVEYNVDRLSLYGVSNITFSIKYLGEQIEDYFGDGSNHGVNVTYVREDKKLGTIGAVKLREEYHNEHLLVMNSDILTNIDYEDMYQSFLESNADIIVATTSFKVQIPYGVVETENGNVVGLKEKPTYTYYSNAGIYIFKKELLDIIPKGEFYNATDFIDDLINKGKIVRNYPILGYWLDIGKPEDFKKAQEDIQHIKF